MSDEILRNSAALNALKRHQLVSLSKRYGLKASGKNVEMIQRLEAYAVTHANDLDFYIPSPAPTPAPNTYTAPPTSVPPTPVPSMSTRRMTVAGQAPTPLKHKESMMSVASRQSDAWEVLSDSGASLISPRKQQEVESGMKKSGSVSSWKSANNGEALNEFGEHHKEKISSSSSMKALATSLTRRGSRILLGRSTSASSQLNLAAEPEAESMPKKTEQEPVEEVVDEIPPSPASTVGIPRRHSQITLLERPSTVRLCSPTPTSPIAHVSSDHDNDELPFSGKTKSIHALKERRSMALRSPMGSPNALSPSGLGRKSMPALPSSSTSASLSFIYPPLPAIPPQFAQIANVPVPGTFPVLPPTPSRAQMIFGSNNEPGVSNQQFSVAAQAVLREMNSRLPGGGAMFDEELLKGRKAEMGKLVKVNEGLGTGGWGLSSGSTVQDRYAEAHQKEFAKMRSISKTSLAPKPSTSRQTSSSSSIKLTEASAGEKRKHELSTSTSTSRIPSAPNGAPLTAVVSGDEGRQAKRKRLSNGPNYLGSLKEAGKSIANLLGEEKGKSGEEMMRKMKERRDKRRSSLTKNKSRGLSSRFSFLRNARKSTAIPVKLTGSTASALNNGAPSIPPRAMSRTNSVNSPRDSPQPRKPFDLEASLARKPTASHRRSTDLTNVIKPHPEVLGDIKSSRTTDGQGHAQKDRGRSTSAQTVLSHSSTAPRRPKIPDFGPPVLNGAALSSKNTLGLPKSSSMSSSLAMSRKASQAEIIKNARPPPPPPASRSASGPAHATLRLASHVSAGTASGVRPASIHRSSTLYLPTASSLARMHATIKPNPERPLPQPPSANAHAATFPTPRITNTVQPFGTASSRDNHLFESNFSVSKPANPPSASLKPKSSLPASFLASGKMPTPAARMRAKHSGLSAVKSKSNLREEMEVKRKRSEIRARQERRAEERELKQMLGDVVM
ncbi:hypothetical protein I316_02558 [Kwoniella heveanensis BCC8398]|uniref:SAP domain-containing protein n=1 Tax=Kwoniella heveanensis BCC8398 TaxID=1296120 RepID=A0A1B9GWU8_9TREE|nr:hypothetical protein I316_02558 [Kwoniella heveanensis BCC8398]